MIPRPAFALVILLPWLTAVAVLGGDDKTESKAPPPLSSLLAARS